MRKRRRKAPLLLVNRQMSAAKRPALLARLGRLFVGLLLLLCGGCLGFLFLFRGYVTLTPEGPALQAPLLAREETLAVFQSGTLDVAPATAPEPLRAVLLPLEAALAGETSARLRAVGGNAVILDMKAEDGSLGYVSALPEAVDARLSEADPTRNEALLAFNRQAGRYSIARVSCFRDEGAALFHPALALRRVSGSPWRDEAGGAWLSLAEKGAQDYVLAVCRELAALGFDELLLENCHFPKAGRQDLLASATPRDPAARTETLTAFYARLQALSAETGCAISLLWAEETADAAGLLPSGQSLEAAVKTAARLWVAEGAEGLGFPVFSGAASQAESALIPLVEDPAGRAGAWACMDVGEGENSPRGQGE